MQIMAIPSKTGADEEKRVRVSFSDSINLIRDQIHWSPKGVSLLTKWPFREGAEIEFAIDHQGERHCCTGVVVECHPLGQPLGFYEIVLFFVEKPCSELVKAACDCHLAHEQDKLEDNHEAVLDGVSNGDGAMGSHASSRLRSHAHH